jgi:predicted ATP-dependent endonuclease of OLD family
MYCCNSYSFIFRNNPIILDEPEAHLDSSLIANYLVNLIKEQKKNRQIIFATHNANFVINADADLIIKLSNEDGITSSNSFTIENLEYRNSLLNLEGGLDAFEKREKKYNIRKIYGKKRITLFFL